MNGVLSYLMASGDAKQIDPILRMMGETNLRHPAGVYKTYGTKSSSFIEAIVEHGAVMKPQVRSIGPGKRVVFTDGSEIEADILVCSTGFGPPNFTHLMPADSTDALLERVLHDASSSVRNLYKRSIHPELPDRLFWVGFARPQHGSIPPISELQARWLAASVSPCPAIPPARGIIRQDGSERRARRRGAARWRPRRYVFLINDLAHLLGAMPPFWRLLLHDPAIVRPLAAIAAQFRLPVRARRGPRRARRVDDPLPTRVVPAAPCDLARALLRRNAHRRRRRARLPRPHAVDAGPAPPGLTASRCARSPRASCTPPLCAWRSPGMTPPRGSSRSSMPSLWCDHARARGARRGA